MQNQKQHLPGLDGLRAIAVMAVIFYHLNLNDFFPGGFLGVDVFFTVSGFLITGLLMRERSSKGSVDIAQFYIRRFRRLAPAMFGVIVACSLAVQFVATDAADQLRKDIPAALFYYSNWWQVVSEQSYFEMMSRPPLLQHLWSLAIEEQFYLLWPITLIFAAARFGRGGVLGAATLLTLATSAWMAFLAIKGNIPLDADPNRLYLGTDTHTSGLFAGAVLACLWNPWHRDSRPERRHRHLLVMGAGLCGLALLLIMFLFTNESQSWLYRGGFLLVALSTATVIISATTPDGLGERLLGTTWLRYLGERSYGLYLWHWPIFVLLRPQDLTVAEPITHALRLALTLLAAELSYRLIETPFRYGKLAALDKPQAMRGLAMSIGAMIPIATLYSTAHHPVVVAAPASGIPADAGQGVPCQPPGCQGPAAAPLPEAAPGLSGPVDMLAIGDSVMLGAKDYLRRSLPGIQVDAEVGRQGRDAIKLLRRLNVEGKLPDTVLIHMGTNGYLPADQFRQLMRELADRKQVFLVNVHASRRWEADNNRLLSELDSGDYKNIRIIDWATVAKDHDEYFVADGIHLTGKGIQAYAAVIRQAMGITGPILSAAQVAARSPAPPAKKEPAGGQTAKPPAAPAQPAVIAGAGPSSPAAPVSLGLPSGPETASAPDPVTPRHGAEEPGAPAAEAPPPSTPESTLPEAPPPKRLMPEGDRPQPAEPVSI
jgi:peptidoglycan/LPS O-acetylase OafA/YrhL